MVKHRARQRSASSLELAAASDVRGVLLSFLPRRAVIWRDSLPVTIEIRDLSTLLPPGIRSHVAARQRACRTLMKGVRPLDGQTH